MYKWLIIGGGIHGTYISNYLSTKGFCEADKIAVLDPFSEPLKNWKEQTRNTGMDYLRSPAEHNLDIGNGALFKFANQNRYGKGDFHKTYKRPKLNLFNNHCHDVIKQRNLSSMRLEGSATGIKRSNASGYVISTNNGDIETENLILSLGASDKLSIPTWASKLTQESDSIQHVFSADYREPDLESKEKIAVVGGGITAAQIALKYAKQKPGSVYLISYYELLSRELDFAPCWTTERCLNNFQNETDYTKRREILRSSRNKGSVPPSIMKKLHAQIKKGNIHIIHGTVTGATETSQGCIDIELDNGLKDQFDFVCLATGFSECPPGGNFYKELIEEASVNCAPCGYPITDKYLQIAKGIFVSGALAELEMGPASRNIVGAKLAAEKIVRAEHRLKLKSPDLNLYYFRSKRNN